MPEEQVRENDQVQAQENGDADKSTNDETREMNDQRAEYVPADPNARDFRVEGNDVRDYIGVDPEYMTYANATEAPILTDTERFEYTDQYDHLEGNAEEPDDEVDTGEYDAKVDVTGLSDDEILALEYKDEDADGRDDDTGLEKAEFERYQAAAQERKDHAQQQVEGDSLDLPL